MVEAAYIKLKDQLWYLRERNVPLALFGARVGDGDKWEMANVIIKYHNQTVLIAHECLKQKVLGQNFSNISLNKCLKQKSLGQNFSNISLDRALGLL